MTATPWRCSCCGRIWGVPSLARNCERKHAADTPAGYPMSETEEGRPHG